MTFSILNLNIYMDLMALDCIFRAIAEIFAKAPSRTRFHNVRAIGLYGVGNIGKTTIRKSLCNDYFAEFSGKVWHVELGKKSVPGSRKISYAI